MLTDSSTLREVLASPSRRSFFRQAGLASMASVLAPALVPLLTPSTAGAAPTPSPTLDAAILNFALNLEYLEAEYYLHATTGTGIVGNRGTTTGGDGTAGGKVTIKDDPKVPFVTTALQEYATEVATDEFNHVKFLQAALGKAYVAAPDINLLDSFNGLAQLAGLGDTFDPFADEVSFLLGAFVFEDVGVSAYRGAAPLIYNRAYIAPAAGILAVEALHAGTIRALLYQLNNSRVSTTDATTNAAINPNPPPPIDQPSIADMVQAISDVRDSVDNVNKDKDQGIIDTDGNANIAATDANGLAFARSTNQVLRIVYGMGSVSTTTPKPGTFFPNGMNGVIR